jgi:hypothetical protein
MFRLVSLVGIVALTVAAAALASAARKAEKKLPISDDEQDDSVLRVTCPVEQRLPCFHARFSRN